MANAAVRDKVNRWKTVMEKLQLFGHICLMSDDRLVKTVTMGMVGDSRLQGRLPRRWSDDITEWSYCTLPEVVRLQKADMNGERKLTTSLVSTAFQGHEPQEEDFIIRMLHIY